jgi:hypothetical protein
MNKSRRSTAGFFCAVFDSEAFIAHSQNKPGGTADIAEHRPSAFVVGAGNETCEEIFHD